VATQQLDSSLGEIPLVAKTNLSVTDVAANDEIVPTGTGLAETSSNVIGVKTKSGPFMAETDAEPETVDVQARSSLGFYKRASGISAVPVGKRKAHIKKRASEVVGGPSEQAKHD
jgi:hypothetical protein